MGRKNNNGRDQSCPAARTLRTSRYKKQVVPDERKARAKKKCRKKAAKNNPDKDYS